MLAKSRSGDLSLDDAGNDGVAVQTEADDI